MSKSPRKKPATRKPARTAKPKGGARIGWVGWAATAGLAGAWAISDGRALHYLRTEFPSLNRTATTMPVLPDRVARMIEADSPYRPKPSEPPVRREQRPPAPAVDQATGSIRPVGRPANLGEAPHAAPPKPASTIPATVPRPAPTPMPMPVLEKPALDRVVPRDPVPDAMNMERPVLGQERHATRKLTAHAAPDGASPRLAVIDTGSSVVVLRSVGDWRYVRSPRSGAEGWVDGRFLAGESAPAMTASAGGMPR